MKKIIVFLFLVVTFLTGCQPAKPIAEPPVPDKPIGGQRDEHGCLGPAGYIWNEESNACIREWELNENQRKAAKIAVDHLGYKYATTIAEVNVARCPGCFSVQLEQGEERISHTITLNNWEVSDAQANDFGCENAGGTWLDEFNECEYVGQEWCENKGGEWKECESACRNNPEAEICTMQCVLVCRFSGSDDGQAVIRNFDDCVNAGYPAMESYPRQCAVPGGDSFTEVIEDNGELLR